MPFLEMVYRVKQKRSYQLPAPILSAVAANRKDLEAQVVVLFQVLAHEVNHG